MNGARPRPPGGAEFIALVSLLTALTAASIDALLPALSRIGRDFGLTDPTATQFAVTLFILGMAFGELLFGPLSDAFGRKKIILAGLSIYGAGTVVALTAASFETLLIGRVIQGVGVSGSKIASRALVRDLFRGDAMARVMSFVFTAFMLVPMAAPWLGQLLADAAGWRAIFIFYLALAALAALWVGARQPETLPSERRIALSIRSLWRNGGRIVRHPKVMAYTFAAGVMFGAQLLYLSTSAALFADLYRVGDRFPRYFAVLALALGAAAFLNGRLVIRYGMHRLSVVALSALVATAALFVAAGLCCRGVPPFAVFMSLCFALFFCVGIVFGNLNAMAMQSLGAVAGIGASLIASISSAVAVALSVSLGQLYNQTVFPLAAAFFAAGLISLTLIVAARRLRAVDL